jgi:hypothetical protein
MNTDRPTKCNYTNQDRPSDNWKQYNSLLTLLNLHRYEGNYLDDVKSFERTKQSMENRYVMKKDGKYINLIKLTDEIFYNLEPKYHSLVGDELISPDVSTLINAVTDDGNHLIVANTDSQEALNDLIDHPIAYRIARRGQRLTQEELNSIKELLLTNK